MTYLRHLATAALAPFEPLAKRWAALYPSQGDLGNERGARLALLQAGYYDAVDGAINAMTGAAGKAAKIEWQVSNTLRRNHPLVSTMGAMLGLTSAQLDDLFTLAASL